MKIKFGKKVMKMNQINGDYVIDSMASQIAKQSIDIANSNALVRMLQEENQELQKEIDELRQEQIDEMDKEEV